MTAWQVSLESAFELHMRNEMSYDLTWFAVTPGRWRTHTTIISSIYLHPGRKFACAIPAVSSIFLLCHFSCGTLAVHW